MIRLGVNIDHVATVRQARGERYPDPVQAATLAELGGADNITLHLREDRRHIQDRDVFALKDTVQIPLNFEMAATDEMLGIAKKLKPHAVTLVPERRQERTTEGGLDLRANADRLMVVTQQLRDLGIAVSLFVEPTMDAVETSQKIGPTALEFHTGRFCHKMDACTKSSDKFKLIGELSKVSLAAHAAGFQSHFGHGLNYMNACWLQLVPYAEEANIGHAIIGRAIFIGLERAVREMKNLLNDKSFCPIIREQD